MPALAALLAVSLSSACISDVDIPECLLKGTCQGGAGGDDAGPPDGAGGKSGSQAAGGVGAEPTFAGEAGQGGQAEPNSCRCAVLPEHLTPACAGKPYQTTLTVSAGRPPYSWKLAPQLDGWTIAVSPDDPEVAILRAAKAPDEATELTLVVTDARNAQRTLTLTLDVRSTCWFAYPSLEPEGPELRLVDPLAETPTPAPLAHAQGVYDFQFSPDGAFLAYRYGVDGEHPKGRHLSLIDLASLKEHAVSFGEDEVVSYAWAPNSATLAAGFQADGNGYLGAVLPPVPGSDDSPTSLTSTPTSVESELYWVGSEYVVFHAASGLGQQRMAYFSEFTSGGFELPRDVLSRFDPGLAVRVTETGFFLITPLQTFYYDLSDGTEVEMDHPDIALMAPSARYTGRLAASGLPQLLPAETGVNGAVASPTDDAQTCTQLLAWATDQERVACVADVSNGDGSSHGEIRIFDLKLDPLRLEAVTLQGFCPSDLDDTSPKSCLVKREGYSFGSQQAAGSARAFSRSGRYFAFARVLPEFVYVYFSDLDEAPARVATPVLFEVDDTNPSPLGFAFSPDERFLLVRRGPRLSVIELATGARGTLALNLLDAAPCSEDFLADPGNYCGNARQAAGPKWAPDSLAAAFRTTDGLTIRDLSPFPANDDRVLPATACAARCSENFSFQP